MERDPLTNPELQSEVEQAHRTAELTIGLGEQLLKQAHELGRSIEDRVSQAAGAEVGCQEKSNPLPPSPSQMQRKVMATDHDKTLLVVEDDDLYREVLTLVLEDEGYAVEPAGNGRDAQQWLRYGPRPDCILLDLSMPRMDGQAFRAWQRQVPGMASVPVVVVSAQSRVAEEAALLGAEDYLQKPVATEDLLAAVRRHCRA